MSDITTDSEFTTRTAYFECVCGHELPADSKTKCDRCGVWWTQIEDSGKMLQL